MKCIARPCCPVEHCNFIKFRASQNDCQAIIVLFLYIIYYLQASVEAIKMIPSCRYQVRFTSLQSRLFMIIAQIVYTSGHGIRNCDSLCSNYLCPVFNYHLKVLITVTLSRMHKCIGGILHAKSDWPLGRFFTAT